MLAAPRDLGAGCTTSTNGGSSGACRAQAARRRRCRSRLSGRARRRAAGQGKLPASSSQFTAGWIALRFLNDPATAAQHFARIGARHDNPISLARAGYWQGRAAEAAGRTQGGARRTTRRPRAIRPPITASSRAPGSASARSRCAAARHVGRQARRGVAARGRARGRNALRARRARSRHPDSSPTSANARHDVDALAALAELAAQAPRRPRHAAARQGRARPRPAVRPSRLPDHRPAALHADRTRGRAGDRLFDRAPGKRVQSADGLAAPMRSA